MAMAKPTLLLIHGAYHQPASWDRVIPQLTAKGYRCVAPQLCFCGGVGKAVSTWKPCVEEIQQLLSAETSAGRDVVVVNHSFGGIAGCNAIEGYTETSSAHIKEGDGRVRGIVQITGMTIKDAAHYTEVFKNVPHTPDENGWKAPPTEIVKQRFYHDLEPADAEYWTSKLVPQSASLERSAEGLYPGYKDVPVWYIICDDDRMLPAALQESFVEIIREVNSRVTVRHINCGHAPMLKNPEVTAEYIHEAAADFIENP